MAKRKTKHVLKRAGMAIFLNLMVNLEECCAALNAIDHAEYMARAGRYGEDQELSRPNGLRSRLYERVTDIQAQLLATGVIHDEPIIRKYAKLIAFENSLRFESWMSQRSMFSPTEDRFPSVMTPAERQRLTRELEEYEAEIAAAQAAEALGAREQLIDPAVAIEERIEGAEKAHRRRRRKPKMPDAITQLAVNAIDGDWKAFGSRNTRRETGEDY